MLKVNISEIIWTIISFAALFFILRKLLYDPIRGFMAERQAKIDAGLRLKKDAQDRVAAIETHNMELVAEAEAQAAEVLRKEKDREYVEHLQTVEHAQNHSVDCHKAAEEEAAKLMEEEEEYIASHTDELARKLARKLLD